MALLASYNQKMGIKNAAHLLRRATFGATRAQIDHFASLLPSEAMTLLFQELQPRNPPVDPATGDNWVNPKPTDANSGGGELKTQTKAWWLHSFIQSNCCIASKSAFFLHTHFTTIASRLKLSPALYYQIRLFENFALGNFKELAKLICLDNAMLEHLDGQLNRKSSPNENYAREFLELYTIGKGPQQGPDDYTFYTEQDVVEAARVFSGYQIDKEFTNLHEELNISQALLKINSQGVANQHDSSAKTFSQAFQNRTIEPTDSVNGIATAEAAHDEIAQLVDMIFDQDATAQHICRKLYRFYVYYEISDEIEESIIRPLAQLFKESDFELKPVLETLFSSEHFFDRDNSQTTDNHIGAIIKSPLDLVMGIHRFFKVSFPDDQSDITKFYDTLSEGILEPLKEQGLPFYEPYEVAGYPAYHQYPGYHRNWISANYLARRYQYAKKLIEGIRNSDGDLLLQLDVVEYVAQATNISDPSDAERLVRELVDYLLPEIISEERFDYFLKAILLDNLSEINWKFEWQRYQNTGDDSAVRGQLEKLFNTILQSPEFQLS